MKAVYTSSCELVVQFTFILAGRRGQRKPGEETRAVVMALTTKDPEKPKKNQKRTEKKEPKDRKRNKGEIFRKG